MTFKKIIPFVLCLSVFAISCKKDKENPSIVGFWKGKYGSNTAYPNLTYAFLFRGNGTVRVFNNSDTANASKAEGTYTVTGNTVKTTYVYSEILQQCSTIATVDSKFTFMEGTWGNGTNTTNGGYYFINKQ